MNLTGKNQHNTISQVRARIKAGEIIDKLQEKFLTDQPLSASEVGAARLLLDKALPSLQHQVVEGQVEHRIQRIQFIVGGDVAGSTAAPADRDIAAPAEVQRIAGPPSNGKDSAGHMVADPESIKLPTS